MTSYVIDIATPLTMVLAETSGAETVYYLHGLDLVAQSDGTTTEYFGYDGLGSVRQTFSSSSTTAQDLRLALNIMARYPEIQAGRCPLNDVP